jgi:predicted signal transduction protein with EAL and GGDEF domain
VIGAVIVFHDVSAARAMSLQMTYTAHHDVVTSLPNRLLLNDRITQSISMALRQSRPFAVLFLDLDHFKTVNDSLGHAGGVEALIRWQQPHGTLIPPAEFVPIAEDCGLIIPIGRWVMREACKQARA